MGLIYTVPQAHCVIVERLGKFSRVVPAGLHMRLPFIERTKDVVADCGWQIKGRRVACKKIGALSVIELSDQRLDTEPRDYHTADNVPVNINAVIFWRITDPEKAVYSVDNLLGSLIDQALNAMRSSIGNRTLDNILTGREELNSEITKTIAEISHRWGVVVQRVEIQELKTDEATTNAMRLEMAAEREKRAAKLTAEAKSQAEILQAEATKKAIILKAEAEKEAAIMIAEGNFKAKELAAEADALYVKKISEAGNIQPEKLISILIASKYVDGFNAISKNPADKVFLPNSFGNMNVFMDANKE